MSRTGYQYQETMRALSSMDYAAHDEACRRAKNHRMLLSPLPIDDNRRMNQKHRARNEHTIWAWYSALLT